MPSSAYSSPHHPIPTPGEEHQQLDAFQRIRSNQENAIRLSPLEEVRTVLANSVRGVLSTFSQKYDGYPSGSMVEFACDEDGSLILALSIIDAHTKDLLSNPKCSLLVARDPEDGTDLVITVHGDAVCVGAENSETVRTAYLAKHPNALEANGEFQLFRIQPKIVRYVSEITKAPLGSGEFNSEEYSNAKVDPISQFSKPILSHMNKDHAEDTKLIVWFSTAIPVDAATMLDTDRLGFYVKGCEGTCD